MDPVCGMTVAADSPLRATHEGKTYVFCNPSCLERFEANPSAFLRADQEIQARAAEPEPVTQVEWTCPMHPEIVRDGPGSCPICGMALEPRTVQLAEEENPELTDMRRRLRASVGLTVPLVVIAMSHLLPHAWAHGLPRHPLRPWLELLLATPVVLWGGWPFLVRGYHSVVNRSLNMFTLIALGVGVAYVYSLVATVFSGIFPASLRGADGQPGVYFEAAAAIVTLVLVGQVLELRARSQTGAALRALLGLAPRLARRLRDDGSEEDVPLAEVHPGDRLRVRPGRRRPLTAWCWREEAPSTNPC